MGLVKFVIKFDRILAVFIPGEMITGRVVVVVNSPEETNGVWIQLKGTGHVAWAETQNHSGKKSSRRKGHTRQLSCQETYFNQEICLFGGFGVGGKFTIPAGAHYYTFTYILPPILPSSFEGTYGYVRYTAQAMIVRSWRFNHDVKESFSVNSIVDLNLNGQARLAPHNEVTQTFGCSWCTAGPIAIKVHLYKGGFVPGENIFISGVIDNHSKKSVKRVVAKLNQCIWYQVQAKTKLEVRTLVETAKGEIDPGKEQVWADVPVYVPQVPPTNLGIGCNIINVYYELEFDATPSGSSSEFKLVLPIVVGNVAMQAVPLANSVGQHTAPSLNNGYNMHH